MCRKNASFKTRCVKFLSLRWGFLEDLPYPHLYILYIYNLIYKANYKKNNISLFNDSEGPGDSPANTSFGMTMTKMLRDALSRHATYIGELPDMVAFMYL